MIKQFYRLKLYAGTEIEVEMQGLDGDLKPYLKLYRVGAESYLHSISTTRNGNWLQRSYDLKASGDYVIMARAYAFKGAGNFEIVYYCDSGPCDGQVETAPTAPEPAAAMHFTTLGSCLKEVEICALKAAVTPTKSAKEILDNCLSVAEVSGKSCALVCTLSETQDLCNDLETETDLVRLQGLACQSELDSCISDCAQSTPVGWWIDDFEETVVAMCHNKDDWTCYDYAKQLTSCGGAGFADDRDDCIMRQHATIGHFYDIVPDEWCD